MRVDASAGPSHSANARDPEMSPAQSLWRATRRAQPRVTNKNRPVRQSLSVSSTRAHLLEASRTVLKGTLRDRPALTSWADPRS